MIFVVSWSRKNKSKATFRIMTIIIILLISKVAVLKVTVKLGNRTFISYFKDIIIMSY